MNIHQLLNQVSASETQLRLTQFLAPCVKAGRVRTRVNHLVYTFLPQPKNFAGWGIFQPVNERYAEVIEEANLAQISKYLQQFKALRLRLAYQLKHQTWLAYPSNEGDMKQRFNNVKPVVVHLVTEGVSFEQIIARWDGSAWWFEDLDRRADLSAIEALQTAFKGLVFPQDLRFSGMTPELRTVYELVTQNREEFSQQNQDEKRLKTALNFAGGTLEQFYDQGEYWTVQWTTRTGEQHSSAISKQDLTVIGAGICLSGRDQEFDLQSLVAVVENRD